MPHHIEILDQTLKAFNAPYLEDGHGDPHLFAFGFLAKVYLYLTSWEVLKKYVHKNILGANVRSTGFCLIFQGEA